MMKVRNCLNVGARTHDFAVQIDFGRRADAGRTGNNVAVEIAHQKVAGPDGRPALVEGLNQKCVTTGKPRADMPAVTENPKIVQKKSGCGDLKSEHFFAVWHALLCANDD